MLQRLVYYSRNAIPGTEQGCRHEIEQILATSRRNNRAAGVTGALMFNTGCFAQILEGPLAAIEATFERIQRDRRHAEVLLLDLSPITARGFASWSMAFVGSSPEDARRFACIAGQHRFDPARLVGERLFELLHRRVLEEELARAA
jgi:hypothetical protein